MSTQRTRINAQIRAPELRVIGPNGENVGVITLAEAMAAAKEAELDLIEVSPNATPPVAKIMDYGKFQYEQQKKDREIRAKSHITETKAVQVEVGTGENDLLRKARQAAGWLKEGHRVRVELFLKGRYKYMDQNFLKERLKRFVLLVPEEYRIAEDIQKGPKGFTMVIEKMGKQKPVAKEKNENK
ncbi:MAG: translation initiation factor IF-3 [Patescibacteria group bacterium]